MSNTKQGIASYVDFINQQRMDEFQNQLKTIIELESSKLDAIDFNEVAALRHIDRAEFDINALINSNRGGKTGLHGFIAESAEVGVANAKRVIQGLEANVQHLNDNGRADLLIDSFEYQMKFYNNPEDALKLAANYRDMDMIYPKDMVQMCDDVMSGAKYVKYKGQNLSLKKINSIKELIEKESKTRNESYQNWMKPSELKYGEVQKNKIHSTLEKKSDEIKGEGKSLKQDVRAQSKEEIKHQQEKAKPKFQEAHKAAFAGATIQGSITLGTSIFKKHKEGKNIFEYNVEDWKELGIDTSKAIVKGGVSGYSIYFLTNFMGFRAPAASAVLTSVAGIYAAVNDFRAQLITAEEFLNQVMIVTSDAGVSAIGATLGQTLIPIPIIGAVVGSSIANAALKMGKNIFNEQEKQILEVYTQQNDEYVLGLDKHYQNEYQLIKDKYLKVDDLQNHLLEINTNVELQLASSVQLAQEFDVPEEEILHNLDEIDKYFLN